MLFMETRYYVNESKKTALIKHNTFYTRQYFEKSTLPSFLKIWIYHHNGHSLLHDNGRSCSCDDLKTCGKLEVCTFHLGTVSILSSNDCQHDPEIGR